MFLFLFLMIDPFDQINCQSILLSLPKEFRQLMSLLHTRALL